MDALSEQFKGGFRMSAYKDTKQGNHKMTLLLHVIDGLYEADKHQLQAVKQEIKNKYPESRKGNVGDYMAAVYSLCKKYFSSIGLCVWSGRLQHQEYELYY